MRRTIIITAAAAVLLLAGCGGGGATSAEARSSAPVPSSTIPSPDAGQTKQLLAALGKVDPGLDAQRSVSRARDTCDAIQRGVTGDKLREQTRARFTGGSVPELSDAQVDKVVAVVKSSFCS